MSCCSLYVRACFLKCGFLFVYMHLCRHDGIENVDDCKNYVKPMVADDMFCPVGFKRFHVFGIS